jgi:flavin reductase (DIM6/NTAB) family NADH-FMN oxidoreductase RutF
MKNPVDPGALSPRYLRRTFGRFATGVTIVTCLDAAGRPVGLTVNSFGSLSLDPPLVQWSLWLDSGYLDAFRQARHFAVNVLAAAQVDLSQRFASAAEDRFGEGHWEAGTGGVPLLGGCAAHFECETESAQPFGDHMLFVGRVLRAVESPRAPLLFHGGRYHHLGAAL